MEPDEQALAEELVRRGHNVTPTGCVTEEVAAEVLFMSPRTLANKRSNRTGPPSLKNARVMYQLRDLLDYLNRKRRSGARPVK